VTAPIEAELPSRLGLRLALRFAPTARSSPRPEATAGTAVSNRPDRRPRRRAAVHRASYVAVDGGAVVLRAAAPDRPWSIVELDLATERWTTVKGSTTRTHDPADVALGEPVEFPTAGDRTAHGFLYRPTNATVHGQAGELPPLIVTSHGGPDGWCPSTAFNVLFQPSPAAGIAVLDVDYGGSTGYGRPTGSVSRANGGRRRGRLRRRRTLAGRRGIVDGRQTAIRGGSASGYTTLCAVTFSETFKAGTSYFGIADLETFRAETHKFESRYDQTLIGKWPEAKQLYHDRSPINFVDQISCPVLILQGADDHVVPPSQAEEIVDALWEKHLPHAYLLFPGEDHGFRAAENIIRSFEAELSFYGQIFGFAPADAIEPVKVEFLNTAGSPAPGGVATG
jgi:dipeptidyl aminopeptidase/acylaminoacyl peptidase